jgi:ferredoxin
MNTSKRKIQECDSAFVDLQKHLNRQAVGFPATKSGSEIKLLKHIFTPLEARISCCLRQKPEPLEAIYERASHLTDSPQTLKKILVDIQKKGGIEFQQRNGRRYYCNAPLVVGMYEFQLRRLSPQFLDDFNAYTSDRKFGIEFLSTELPQMRTIPIKQSIHLQHQVSSYDDVVQLIQQADAPFVILECICRKKHALQGEICRVTDRTETCMAIGNMAQMALASELGREIPRDEAIAIITQNQRDGLVLQPSNTKKAEFICSCCGCCCGMLRIQKRLPLPLEFWASNFQAVMDTELCTGCGVCQQECQVDAVTLSAKYKIARVAVDRCIGCGICVSACPTDAISLKKKMRATVPPETREELLDIIRKNKKGKLDKLMLTGKLVFDALRTGKTDLIQS